MSIAAFLKLSKDLLTVLTFSFTLKLLFSLLYLKRELRSENVTPPFPSKPRSSCPFLYRI